MPPRTRPPPSASGSRSPGARWMPRSSAPSASVPGSRRSRRRSRSRSSSTTTQLRGTYGNRAALRLFGRSFVERPIEEWGRATEPRDERGPSARPGGVAAGRGPARGRPAPPARCGCPMSGRDVLVDVEGTPIPGGGAVLLLRDVGKEEEERRRLSRFASFVAHELRNPLAVAKARIELAQRDPNLSERAAGHSGARARVGRRRDRHPRAARALLARRYRQHRGEPRGVRPRAGGRRRHRAAAGARAPSARCSSRCGPDVQVVGDRHLTEQAITNLLTNADRYSTAGAADPRRGDRPGRRSTLRGARRGARASPTTSPSGCSAIASRPAAGLGLGLYLVSATMQAMGGSVQLEQRRPAAVFALRWSRGTRAGATTAA